MHALAHSRRLVRILLAVVVLLLCTVAGLVLLTWPPQWWGSEETQTEVATTTYLHAEEVVIITSATSTEPVEVIPIEPVLFEYIEVVDSCGPHFEGDCLNAREGPGTDFPVQRQLRNGVVLKVGGQVVRDGEVWYRIVFDEWLRFPERAEGDWYVHADYVAVLYDEGDKTIWEDGAPTSTEKRIVVDRTKQTLTAYEGETLFLRTPISTGLELTPTPRGEFTVFKKTPSRYMQGPLPGLIDQQVYDLPGVPWNLYFTHGGAVIHGAYWHNSFGSQYSHGCVNVAPDIARVLYTWAELGMTVTVVD